MAKKSKKVTKVKKISKKIIKSKPKKINKNLIATIGLIALVFLGGFFVYQRNATLKNIAEIKKAVLEFPVIRKESKTYRNGNIKQLVFSIHGKKIATQTYKKDGSFKKSCGFIPDGMAYEYYPNKRLKAEASYEQSKRNGAERVYYPNGQLMALLNYTNEELTNRATVYYENGALFSRWRYDLETKTGTAYFYFKDGRLAIEAVCNSGLQFLDLVNKIDLQG